MALTHVPPPSGAAAGLVRDDEPSAQSAAAYKAVGLVCIGTYIRKGN